MLFIAIIIASNGAIGTGDMSNIPAYKDLEKFVPPLQIAKVLRVYDGDSVTVGGPLRINSTNHFYKFSVRIAGIDCPEIRTKNPREKQVALEAKQFVQDRILNRVVKLTDRGLDKYGRLLARVSWGGEDLATQLLDAKLAVPYDGGKKTVVKDWVAFRNKAGSKTISASKPQPINPDESIFEHMPQLRDLAKFIPPIHAGKVVRVYDGDSFTIGVPLLIANTQRYYKFSVRVAGIDCPEIRTKNPREKQVAIEAKEFVQGRILNRIVHLTDVSLDKYGRVLARVSFDGQDLATQLIAARLAVAYDGGTKTKVEDWVAFRNQAE